METREYQFSSYEEYYSVCYLSSVMSFKGTFLKSNPWCYLSLGLTESLSYKQGMWSLKDEGTHKSVRGNAVVLAYGHLIRRDITLWWLVAGLGLVQKCCLFKQGEMINYFTRKTQRLEKKSETLTSRWSQVINPLRLILGPLVGVQTTSWGTDLMKDERRDQVAMGSEAFVF